MGPRTKTERRQQERKGHEWGDWRSSWWEGEDCDSRQHGQESQDREDSSSEDQERWQRWSGYEDQERWQWWRPYEDWWNWYPCSSWSWRWWKREDWDDHYQSDQEAWAVAQEDGDSKWDKATDEPEPQPQEEEPQPHSQVVAAGGSMKQNPEGQSSSFSPGSVGDEAVLKALHEYVSSLPRDTWAEWSRSALWKVDCNQQDGKYRAELQLPPGCLVRRRFYSRPCDGELEAKGEAARAEAAREALRVLAKRGQVEKDWAQGSVLPPQETQAAQEDEEELTWPLECPGFELGAFEGCDLSRWPQTWPEKEAHAHVVEETHGGHRYGFLSSIATEFNYQLSVNSKVLRLEAKPVRWDHEHASTVREFHEMLTYQTGGPIIVAVVWLKTSTEHGADTTFDLDLDGMTEVATGEAPADVPEWLRLAHSQLERLRCLEVQISRFAPTSPAPSPLKLEAVFGDAPAHRDACEALSLAGEGVLQLMAALSARAERPWDTALQLQQRAQSLLRERRLARLLVESGLPLACGRSLRDVSHAATVLKALVGAHYLEADPFAVAKLWRWLCGRDELRLALLHLGGSEPFLGRSETYTELWEGRPEQLKELLPTVNGGELGELGEEPWLLVRYAEFDDAIYRRSGSFGEELRLGSKPTVAFGDLQDSWPAVVWHPNLGTYCSPSMLEKDCKHKPLPNKVTAWLRGRPFGSLARLKKCDATAAYSDLRETRDGKLLVTFKDKEIGKKCFCRADDGGLGLEMDVEEEKEEEEKEEEGKDETWEQQRVKHARVLGFSEENKTLLSLALRKHGPLPNRIAEWVHGARSLAQLAPVRKAAGQEDYKTHGETACWEQSSSSSKTEYQCRLEMTDHGGVFLARRYVGDEKWGDAKWEGAKWEELLYSEERKQWEVCWPGPSGEHVPVPHGAVAWLQRDLDELTSVDAVPARLSKAPWLQAPAASLKFFQHIASLNLAVVEDKLSHVFRNPQLLAEALTHCSFVSAASPSLDRLAVLGEATVQCHVGKQLVKRARFPTAATATHKETDAILASEFAAPKELEHWKALRRRTAGADWLDESSSSGCADLAELRRRRAACCNHVSYARTAVKLDLHKVLQHNSSELGKQIRRFARMVERGADWPALITWGTPRALGDVFLACVGATVLDGKEANEADKLVEKHIEFCRDFQPKEPKHVELKNLRDLREPPPGEPPPEELQWAWSCKRIQKKALAPDPPPNSCSEGSSGRGVQEGQRKLVAVLTDLHSLLVDGVGQGGTSPRSTALAAALDALGEAPELSDSPDDGAASADDSLGAGRSGEGKFTGGEGAAIQCTICDMWLNGQRQWEDHKSGKKHLKNTRQAQQSGGHKTAGSRLGAGAVCKMEPPPAGGKRREVLPQRRTASAASGSACAPEAAEATGNAGAAKEAAAEEGQAHEMLNDKSTTVEELQSTVADSQAATSSLGEAPQQHCPGPGYEGPGKGYGPRQFPEQLPGCAGWVQFGWMQPPVWGMYSDFPADYGYGGFGGYGGYHDQ